MDFKVGDQFCFSDMLIVYTICSIQPSKDSVICTAYHPNITLFAPRIEFTGERLMDVVKLPTLEEPPTWAPHVNSTRDATQCFWSLGLADVVTEKPEGIQSEAALKFIEATKKQVDIGMIKMLKCAHDRATYDSGWSKYDYCKKCDYKFTEDDK